MKQCTNTVDYAQIKRRWGESITQQSIGGLPAMCRGGDVFSAQYEYTTISTTRKYLAVRDRDASRGSLCFFTPGTSRSLASLHTASAASMSSAPCRTRVAPRAAAGPGASVCRKHSHIRPASWSSTPVTRDNSPECSHNHIFSLWILKYQAIADWCGRYFAPDNIMVPAE